VRGNAHGDQGPGVYGYAAGTEGKGVYGIANNSGDFTNYGGQFKAMGTYGYGVSGEANGADGHGVHGYSSGANGFGIYGESTQNVAVKGKGAFNTSGYLGVQGKDDFDGVVTTDWLGYEIGVAGISTGTVGQPDAGVTTSGSYTLTGGFWSSGIPCFVNMDDLENFLTDWLEGGTNLPGDLDGDNKVDMVDFGILASNWLCRCPADWPL